MSYKKIKSEGRLHKDLKESLIRIQESLHIAIKEFELADIHWDNVIDPKIKDDDVLEEVLNKNETFVLNCMRLKQILVTLCYAIQNPEFIPELQENTIIAAMKHEISTNNPPEEVVDTLLDYMNKTKKY